MNDVSFEIKSKDVAGRIGLLSVNGRSVETPALMPVYNIQKAVIPVAELAGEFKVRVLMTNAYSLLKNPELDKQARERGIHRLLGFDGIIATDSGSYQLMVYGSVTATNREVLDFEQTIGTDIGSFLDIPTLPDAFKPRAEEQLKETLKRAIEARDATFAVNAGIQGGRYLDLRKKAAQEIGRNFRLTAIGGIVPLMESYRFQELVNIIATVKQNLPCNRVVHAFGLGHPMVFSLAVALGCDLFDSAAYSLYAQDDRYMTLSGTKRLSELDYLPCSCPVCNKHGLGMKELEGDERTSTLARHNLYLSMQEINTVKQAIKENALWELVAMRCRAHPRLLDGLNAMLSHAEWLATLDPITKKSAFKNTGPEAEMRTEVVNARRRIARVKSDCTIDVPFFGKIPAALADVYPFNSVIDDYGRTRVRDLEKTRVLMDYQFGMGAGSLIPESVRIKKSRTTQRIRWIYEKGEMIASVRAQDHFIIPHTALAERLLKKFPKPRLRVVMKDDPDVIAIVREGKSVFAKFVADVDRELSAGDECLIVDARDNLIRTGTLALAPQEILDFDRGVAVRVR